MKMKISVFVVFLMIAAAAVASPSDPQQIAADATAPSPRLLVAGNELGELFGNRKLEANIQLTNLQDASMDLVRVVPRFAKDKIVNFKPVRVGKGATASVQVSIEVGSEAGRFAHYFDVYQKGADEPVDTFAVRGFADWIVDPASTRTNFGSIDVDSGVERTLTVALRPGEALRMTRITESDRRFDATISADGTSLKLKSRSDAPLGLFDTRVVVATNHAYQKHVGFALQGQIVGRIVPDSNPVEFGLFRVGEGGERLVRLTQLDGRPIRISGVRTEGAKVDAELRDCMPVDPSCKLLRLNLPPQLERGQVGGFAYLDLVDYGRELPIRFGAIVIGKDTQIRNLNEDMKAAADMEEPVASILKSAVQTPLPPGKCRILRAKVR